MTANGISAQEAFAPVLSALATLQANVDRAQKAHAHEFLEKFQKSPDAWTTTTAILQSSAAPTESKLFAATTLKGKVGKVLGKTMRLQQIADASKIVYDIHQLSHDSLPPLRDLLLSLLMTYRSGPKPIRTQLCVCLANLAIQMTEWKDVLQHVVSALGNQQETVACILEFLSVLPEEVTEGRKINLTEEELSTRTAELLEDNAEQVLALLSQYAQSSASAAKNPQLLHCITSWLREVPLNDIVNSPLLMTIIDALSASESFEPAVECICAIFKETKDVDECLNIIQTLYSQVVALRPRISAAAEAEDAESFKGMTRIFAEAGEAWVLLIARMPAQFRELVELVLECAARDQERDAISLTFNFWYELKQYITLQKYMQAGAEFGDIYSKLVDIMIGHLEYPQPESGNEADLFEGDREQEDKFREFRHQMGDVLKDCCEVIGVTECLKKAYDLIETWVNQHGAQVSSGQVPQWQKLEAPLFAMRAMGRMVPSDENVMLPRLMPLLVQIPDQEKVRFQAVMALGRYTEWTARHPDTLQPQLHFIMAAFKHPSKEVVRAAALSFKFFCDDCADLLKDHVTELQAFYESVLDSLPSSSQDEVTEGVASVIAKQPLDKIYETFKLYCDPVINRLVTMARNASDEKRKLALADHLQLVTIFVQWIRPYVDPSQPNPAVKYCQEMFPVLAALVDSFITFTPILERVCRCWRYMVISYRTAMAPLLPALAEKLAAGFSASRQGCFLWATDSIVREFSEGAEQVDTNTSNAIYHFYEQQTVTFLRALNDLPPEELPDVIEDYFRLSADVLLYYPQQTLTSQFMTTILSAASTSLTLLKEEPLMATLHFLRDFLAYGGEWSPSSNLDAPSGTPRGNPPEIRAHVRQLLVEQGEILTQRLMTGMMYNFPRDCFPDASGVLLGMFQLLPQQVVEWVRTTISALPPGSISSQESEKFLNSINQRIQAGETRKFRTLLQDFTNSYRRRNVAPREGLGRLEATRFRFSG